MLCYLIQHANETYQSYQLSHSSALPDKQIRTRVDEVEEKGEYEATPEELAPHLKELTFD